MRNRWVRRAAAAASFVPAALQAQADPSYAEARAAWDRGDYPVALRTFERLLLGTNAARYLEPVALLTGELFRTTELTPDGRGVKISPTGRWIAYERGSTPRVWTVLVAGGEFARRDSLEGTAVAFDDARGRVAVLRTGRLVVREASGAERVYFDSTMAVASPVFAADGAALHFIGKRLGETGTHVWSLDLTSMTPRRLTTTDAPRSDLQAVAGGRSLLWLVGRDPFGAGRGGGGGGGRGGPPAGGRAGGGGGVGGGAPREFVVRDLASGAERSFTGSSPSVASDGSLIAFVEDRGAESFLQVVKPGGEVATIKRTTDELQAPAVSPDGASVAYQLRFREDWEIYVADADGKNERRITHEIQHDVLPKWITPTTLLGMIGEPRHRRSFLYDARTGARTRLFHNNTVRTVAPEYEWVVAGDGSMVGIVAERDGDTVSPERGVYVVDLRTRVTTADVLARVRGQLSTELALRADARRRFTPVAPQIRAVTEQVSKDRIYWYARDLFNFDSKHVSRPGNAKAIAYLDSVYRSFGYEPQLQWFEPRNNPKTANVIAVLKGTVSPDVVYVVGSHFDSRAEGPGADDNTSGTTMLLETARVLARHPLPATVMFASFTGEEAGLLGSREFVRRARADSLRLAGAMNNDMMGWSNDQRLDNTIRYSNPGIRDIQHGAALEFSRLITYDALYYKSTDAAAFYEAYGDIIGGFGSYPILGNPHYHQSHDVLETINFEQMAENTKANVATVMMLAMAPSRVTGLVASRTPGGVTLRWTRNPERDIRDYQVRWTGRDGVVRTQRASVPNATIAGVPSGATVMVKAVNTRGLDGWDWARVVVQ